MNVYYRYMRPCEFVFNDIAPRVVPTRLSPRGGICFRIEDDNAEHLGHPVLNLSYSICHDDDVFSKDIARRIADQRAIDGFKFEVIVTGKDIGSIANGVQRFKTLISIQSALNFYRDADFQILCDKVAEIQRNWQAVGHLVDMNKDIIVALGLKDAYARAFR